MIVCDIDGTIADSSARALKAFGPKGDSSGATEEQWNKFFIPQEMLKDPVIPFALEVLEILRKKHHIVMLTGRREDRREPTILWLRQNDIPFDRLIMRAKKYYDMSTPEYKELVGKTLKGCTTEWDHIAFEDEPKNVEALLKAGYDCHKAPECWEPMFTELMKDEA
jgi:beta-phosphoglucomutase-like phosphatase (HAD superfamily)